MLRTPRAGESAIMYRKGHAAQARASVHRAQARAILGPARRRERKFEQIEKKRAATRRRELDLEAGRPPRAGESSILEHCEENVR